MVLFGAPAACPDHALRAVRTAVAMVRRVHELKERWAALDFAGLRIGVGVHTGRVIAGTVGSRRRLDYSAIGDTVNAASRIEAQNKEFGTEVLISWETYKELPPAERQALGCAPESRPAKVKGKTEELRLHAVEVGKAAPVTAS
jgi:adenylate cyclase